MKIKMKYIAIPVVSTLIAGTGICLYQTHKAMNMLRTYNRNHQNSPLVLSKKNRKSEFL